MHQFHRLTLMLLATMVIYLCQTADCWGHQRMDTDQRLFYRKKNYKLSQTYNDVTAIALHCISNGDQYNLDTAFFADVHFTFEQANGTTSGTYRHVYSSQHFSMGIWKADDIKGIQLSSISVMSHWNTLHCDFVNVTTSSKSVQLSVTIPEHDTVLLQCSGNTTGLTLTSAEYGSNKQTNCTADVTDVVTKYCNTTTDSNMCTFPVQNEQLGGDPCFSIHKTIQINYICTQSNCMPGNDSVDDNCSRVWTESLVKEMPWNSHRRPTIGVSPSNLDLKQFEKRMTQLETEQRRTELKDKTQKELFNEQHYLIHEWIIPTLELIALQSDSLRNNQGFIQHMERLLKHAEKSYEAFKKHE